jgi:hypothetical protein
VKRIFLRTGVVLAAALLLTPGARMYAQGGGGGYGQGGQGGYGGGRGGRGGFGGGQMVQGTVTANTPGKLTIKTDAGDSYDVTVTDTTRVMENRQAIKLSDVKAGDSVTAMGTVDADKKTVQAMMVNAVDAATVAKAKENLGKTYVTGKITAIDADNLKLTVMRTDNVSQVIQVDEGTSFQRGTRGVQADVQAAGGLPMGGGFGGFGGGRQGGAGGQGAPPPAPESITLADIKVGDTVMASGALKNGVFTPTKMGVTEPGAAGEGRRRQADGAGQGAPAASPGPPAGPAPPAPPQ